MNKIHVLDCTLRDGGYCNQWNFGNKNIKKIINSLVSSNIDIIECGFLTNKYCYSPELSKFNNLEQIEQVLPINRHGKLFVVMVNYGEYCVEDLPLYNGKSIDGIRIAFHKRDLTNALELAKAIQLKGYKIFMQPMVTLSYTDLEFISLIEQVNEFTPYAFYIVDSFGMIKKKDLIRLFYMVENNLKDGIWIGFHSHNNMQLSYSNAQSLIDTKTNCNIIIDSSVYGMGRGAGNLNTELLIEYLNENVNGSYCLKPLLNVIDEVLNNIYDKNYWGYSLANYVSASHCIHPDYASYLNDKNTLTFEAMDEIFSIMQSDKKNTFDREYIQNLYTKYMDTANVQEEHRNEFENVLLGKKVLLICPGKSSKREKDKILKFINQNNVVSISVNFDYSEYNTDFIFLSNLRRFRELQDEKKSKCIVTSNIPADNVYLQTRYYDLLNDIEAVKDNAAIMAIRFLINLGVKKVYLAGMDGYSHDVQQNYADKSMIIMTKNIVFVEMNNGICMMLDKFRKEISIEFLTQISFVR